MIRCILLTCFSSRILRLRTSASFSCILRRLYFCNMSSISVKQEPGGEGETARGERGAGARVLGACKEEPGISATWMEHVKEEPTYLNLENVGSCTEAAALAGLYTDHAVKDQLVLGLESIQYPKGASFSVCVKMEEFADAAEWGEGGESEGRSGTVGAASESETNTRVVKQKQASQERPGRPPVRRPLRPPRPAPPRPPARPPPAPRPPDYTFAHSCPHCGKGFRNQFVFTRHLFTHNTLKPRKTLNNLNKTQSKPLKCSHCRFKSRDALVWRQHQSVHDHDHDVKKPSTKFRCESCEFTCGRRTELQRHSRTLHDRLTCNTRSCGYTTRRATTLRRHQATCHPAPT